MLCFLVRVRHVFAHTILPAVKQTESNADVFLEKGFRLRSYHSGSSIYVFDDLEIDLQDKLESVFDLI